MSSHRYDGSTTRRDGRDLLRALVAAGPAAVAASCTPTPSREEATTSREARAVVAAQPSIEGAGVRLRRSLGSRSLPLLDPFLMLDEFYSDNPDDYLAGFPSHPHRGFANPWLVTAPS